MMTEMAADRNPLGQSHAAPRPDGRPGLGNRALIGLFLVEAIVLAIAQLPLSMSWDTFAFMDQGANLAIQNLLGRGLLPTVDFGYLYGLLPLLVGRVWFSVFGLTPIAYAGAMLVVDLLIAWGLARCILAMKAGPAAIALVAIAMPFAALGSYINFAHAIEAVLICHALAEHALGRKSRALVLLTACLFVKPTMAYAYGFLLTLIILRDGRAIGVRGVLRALTPAIAVAVILLAVCGFWFGLKPIMHTLLPVTGARDYQYMNFGFFRGVGRQFWLPQDMRPAYYVFNPAGHYLIGTVILVCAAAVSLVRGFRGAIDANAYTEEVVACCAIMQCAFLLTFYGDFMSWTYYYYILIIGLVGFSVRGGRAAALVLLVAIAALVGDRSQVSWVKASWLSSRPIADMAGLWASESERKEWLQVLDIVADEHASVISMNGEGLTTIMPGFAPAENVFLFPGIPLPSDLRRKLDQVDSATFILFRKTGKNFLALMPEFREALDGCEVVLSSPHYVVYKRLRPPSS
jgi:hypothetical protein